eukprot:5437433-Amphidinium_carterae.2
MDVIALVVTSGSTFSLPAFPDGRSSRVMIAGKPRFACTYCRLWRKERLGPVLHGSTVIQIADGFMDGDN